MGKKNIMEIERITNKTGRYGNPMEQMRALYNRMKKYGLEVES